MKIDNYRYVVKENVRSHCSPLTSGDTFWTDTNLTRRFFILSIDRM